MGMITVYEREKLEGFKEFMYGMLRNRGDSYDETKAITDVIQSVVYLCEQIDPKPRH